MRDLGDRAHLDDTEEAHSNVEGRHNALDPPHVIFPDDLQGKIEFNQGLTGTWPQSSQRSGQEAAVQTSQRGACEHAS